MSIEELRVEAEKHGYYLVEKPKNVGRLKKCPECGHYPSFIRGDGDYNYGHPKFRFYAYHVKCMHCGTRGITTSVGMFETKRDAEIGARKAWNEAVENGTVIRKGEKK